MKDAIGNMQTFGSSVTERAAQQLEADIRRRGLSAGSRYFSTIEAGQMLGVSAATAHRAMKLLADRNLIVRRMKSGTFVGPKVPGASIRRIETVYLLTTPEKREYASANAGYIISGLRRALSNVNVQFTLLPSHDPVAFVRSLLDSTQAAGGTVGFVASSCPFEVCEFLAESGTPTVVSGTLPLGGPDLPSVALDDHEGGRLLAQYLVDGGHRRFALLATSLDRPGDKLLFDGIVDPLARAGLPHNALSFQIVAESAASVGAAVRHFLELPDRPTAIIARSEQLADLVSTALSELGLRTGKDIDVVFIDHATSVAEQSPYPHVQSKQSREEGAMLMGEMLARLSRGETPQQYKVVIPMELCNARNRGTQ